MANRARGEIVLDLDKTRTWNLTWKQIGEIENALAQLRKKKVTWREFCQDFQNWGIEDYALVLWGGLHHEDRKLTLDAVLEMANSGTFQQFVFEFGELLQDSIPERLKKKYMEGNPQAPQPTQV